MTQPLIRLFIRTVALEALTQPQELQELLGQELVQQEQLRELVLVLGRAQELEPRLQLVQELVLVQNQ